MQLLSLAPVLGLLVPALALPGEGNASPGGHQQAHDPVWENMSGKTAEVPFVGDGELGMRVTIDGEKILRFDVASSRARDHRTDDLWEGKAPPGIEAVNRGRLPVGRFELTADGVIDAARSTARIHLATATASGELVTDRGSVKWRAFIHATERVGVIELEPGGGESGAGLDFASEEAVAPGEHLLPEGMRTARIPNPKPYRAGGAGRGGVVWDLAAGGQTVSTWRRNGNRMFWTIEHSFPEKNAVPGASARVAKAADAVFADWEAAHGAWWHRWYEENSLSFGSPYWQGFYWNQIYRKGSTTSAGRADPVQSQDADDR